MSVTDEQAMIMLEGSRATAPLDKEINSRMMARSRRTFRLSMAGCSISVSISILNIALKEFSQTSVPSWLMITSFIINFLVIAGSLVDLRVIRPRYRKRLVDEIYGNSMQSELGDLPAECLAVKMISYTDDDPKRLTDIGWLSYMDVWMERHLSKSEIETSMVLAATFSGSIRELFEAVKELEEE